MSVYKSRRKDAAAQFIMDARELRKKTAQFVKRFPTSYRWITTNGLLEMGRNIFLNCVAGNEIFIHKDLPQQDFDLRHRYLKIAEATTASFLAELTFAYELVDKGNNFFDSKYDYEAAFSELTTIGNTLKKRLRSLLYSDKERYTRYQKEKSAAAAKDN